MQKPVNLEYQTLDDLAIVQQLLRLRARVVERFPLRGLTKTVSHLADIARPTAREAASLRDPHWGLRALSVLAILAALYGFYMLLVWFRPKLEGTAGLTDFTQGLEASFNILVLSGLFVVFFVRLERRYKREKALTGLYRLRAIAHVVDMHQLQKDPASVAGKERTPSSPVRDLTNEQLLRYLDYCSECLSLTGKLAALYAQHFPETTVISAVNDIEQLTTNLSSKIWQKIMLVQAAQQSETVGQ